MHKVQSWLQLVLSTSSLKTKKQIKYESNTPWTKQLIIQGAVISTRPEK
jgi:hypothetical protein